MANVTELHRRDTTPVRLLHAVNEAASRLSIGRTALYGLLRNDVIPSVLIGGKRLVAEADLVAYVEHLRATTSSYAETAS